MVNRCWLMIERILSANHANPFFSFALFRLIRECPKPRFSQYWIKPRNTPNTRKEKTFTLQA